jgi:uncharacterized membrane protein YeaQ/YmgE (transglycosylase-associated protein family)
MIPTLTQLIVWLIVGGLAGTLAGRLVTFQKKGLGFWVNLGIGMAGALIGGFIFHVFNIGVVLAEIKITLRDLIAAFLGSLLFVVLWWLIRKFRDRKSD